MARLLLLNITLPQVSAACYRTALLHLKLHVLCLWSPQHCTNSCGKARQSVTGVLQRLLVSCVAAALTSSTLCTMSALNTCCAACLPTQAPSQRSFCRQITQLPNTVRTHRPLQGCHQQLASKVPGATNCNTVDNTSLTSLLGQGM